MLVAASKQLDFGTRPLLIPSEARSLESCFVWLFGAYLGPKLFVPSQMVKVHVAARCGLSIGPLLALFSQDGRHNGAPFVANTSASTIETTPLSRDLHVQHKFNLQAQGGGTLK